MLRNLLDNAIRHSPSGGTVRVSVETKDKVVIAVEDDGPGVPEAEREHIFAPFHRSPAARADAHGAGLGLAIARELARSYGGDVALSRAPNRFEIFLPAASIKSTAVSARRAASSASVSLSPFNRTSAVTHSSPVMRS